MKRLLTALAGLLTSGAALAAGGHALPYQYQPDYADLPSLQRGARNFVAYCSGCHSMQYLRYNRIAKDLEIPEVLMTAHLMPVGTKPGDVMLSAMPAAEAKTWLGQTPPDLTLETRARGADWVYSYMKTFYVDPARPLGVNNLVLPGASMPHVLAPLQGWQIKPAKNDAQAEGDPAAVAAHGKTGSGLQLAQPGTLSEEEYDEFVGDLVNFMAYAAEPGKAQRIDTGFKAILYLFVLLVLAYFLKKEFWKDVH